jgi:hypothetical protein
MQKASELSSFETSQQDGASKTSINRRRSFKLDALKRNRASGERLPDNSNRRPRQPDSSFNPEEDAKTSFNLCSISKGDPQWLL